MINPIIDNTAPAVKVRVLKKVRRNFINKTPEEQQERPGPQHDVIVSVPIHLKSSSYNIIDPYIGIVEKNRKVYFGNHYVQSSFTITNVSIDKTESSQAVTVNIEKRESDQIMTLEAGIKRLESYGDLELAALGHKIKNRYTSCIGILAKYQNLVSSEDPNVLASIRKAKNQASLRAREIESKYLYQKTLHFVDKCSSRLLSMSYSKELIEQAGYNIHEIVDWIKANGLPCIFKGDNSMHLDIMKIAVERALIGEEMVKERPEFVIPIYDKEGAKRYVVCQTVFILEPAQENVFLSTYSFIKRVQERNEEMRFFDNIGDASLKKKKVDADGENNVRTDATNIVDSDSDEIAKEE